MSKVISQGKTKEAALYFDKVFPDDAGPYLHYLANQDEDSIAQAIHLELNPEEAIQIFREIVGVDADQESYLKYWHISTFLYIMSFAKYLKENDKPDSEKSNTLQIKYDNIRKYSNKHDLSLPADVWGADHRRVIAYLSGERRGFLDQVGFREADIWSIEQLVKPSDHSENEGVNAGVEVALSGLNLVDPNELSWAEIIEFRRDAQRLEDLRKVRLFFREELAGKDQDYVKDRLLSLQYEHEQAAKYWGLRTTQKAFSVILDNRSLAASGVGGFAAMASGLPVTAAAAIGAVVPLGRFALELSGATLDAVKERSNNPVAYLTRLKNLDKK